MQKENIVEAYTVCQIYVSRKHMLRSTYWEMSTFVLLQGNV